VSALPNCGSSNKCGRGGANQTKIKKQRISPLLLSGWYLPRYFANSTYWSGVSVPTHCRRRADADDSIRDRAEVSARRLVGSQRVGVASSGSRRAGDVGRTKRIAALGTRGERGIDQASAGRSRGAQLVPESAPRVAAKPPSRRTSLRNLRRVDGAIDALRTIHWPQYARVAGSGWHIAAMIKMIATTIRSSISEKPFWFPH